MNQVTFLQIVTLLVAIISAAAAWAAFVRAGKWRDSDEGKAVKTDIHTIKNEITRIDARLGKTERACEDMPALSERMKAVETRLESVASAGDFRELKAELEGLELLVRNTHAATQRIEGWLMEKG